MPFPWISIAISAAFTFVGQLLAKKPKSKPVDLEGFQVPTATEDRPKPMWVGTVRHRSPNCIWYGDYSAKPLKNSVGILQGILSLGGAYLSRQVIGYNYHLGFQLDLGWGELDEIIEIIMNDKSAWTGSESDGTITIDRPDLFGGSEGAAGPQNGGFQGRIVIYPGDGLQDPDPYVVAASGPTPAYRKDILLVAKGLTTGGAFVGNTAALPEIHIIGRRCPNTLGVTGGKHIIDTYDANPVCALYEFMTRANNEYGGGYSVVQFNTGNWIAAAEQVHSEGLGISRMFDTDRSVDDVVDDYLQLIDGVININMTTGKFELVLARNDYDVDDILEIGDDEIIELVEYKRGAWAETFNEVKLSYIDRTQNFESIPIAAQDGANSSGQAEVNSTTVSIEGLSNPTTANKALWRELKVLSSPLATIGLKLTRAGFQLYGGAVFKYVGSKIPKANGLIFRVTTVDGGTPTANAIEIKATQDVYSLTSAAWLPPQPTEWEEPNIEPTNIVDQFLIEQPYFFHGTDDCRVASIAAQPDGAQLSYDLYTKLSTTTDYGAAKRNGQLFTPKGTLANDYSSSAYDTSGDLIVTPVSLMNDLPATVTPEDITIGAGGLIIIGNEILAYEEYTVDIDGNFVFSGVWGGLLDTVLADHAEDDPVWFISEGIGLDFTSYAAASTIKAKLTSKSATGTIDLASATEITL